MNDGWDEILDADEHIIWQGRPDQRFRFQPKMLFTMIFGLFFAGFALLWMIGAAAAGGIFWMFGLIHFFVGLSLAFGSYFKDTFMRRRTWYSLSTRRAYIATDIPIYGRSLKAYPIGPSTPIIFEHKIMPSVYFSSKSVRRKNRYTDVPIGFEMIEDGQKVLQLIEGIQKSAKALAPT